MEYARLGRTEAKVSRLIFGCGMIGGLMIKAEPEVMLGAVRDAMAAGINWFDTAAQYGDGKSEKNLGRVLGELGETPGISTKFKLRAEAGDIPGQIERALEQSLLRLGMDGADLFQLHNNILLQASGKGLTPDQILEPGGVIESLERMRDQGLTKLAGGYRNR